MSKIQKLYCYFPPEVAHQVNKMLTLGRTEITLGCATMLDTVLNKKKLSREFSSAVVAKQHSEESEFRLLAKDIDSKGSIQEPITSE